MPSHSASTRQTSQASLPVLSSPSTAMDTALRRTHPKYLFRVDQLNTSSTTALAQLFSGALLAGLGWHLWSERSLVGLCGSVMAFTMLVTLVYRLFGGGSVGHRSFREQGHFLCEAACADVLCDMMDWCSSCGRRRRWVVVLVVIAVGEVVGRFCSAGLGCIAVGLFLIHLAVYNRLGRGGST